MCTCVHYICAPACVCMFRLGRFLLSTMHVHQQVVGLDCICFILHGLFRLPRAVRILLRVLRYVHTVYLLQVPGGAVREAGSVVRVTEMFYAVAKDTAFTKQRINRFMQQMSFARRAQGHAHGSLVTGKGSWGSSAQDAPITLQKKGFRNLWGLLA